MCVSKPFEPWATQIQIKTNSFVNNSSIGSHTNKLNQITVFKEFDPWTTQNQIKNQF